MGPIPVLTICRYTGTDRGDYADCTDLAYQKAVDDGADVIDCPVQVTRDGILICMSSIDLIDDTTVTKSPFSSQVSVVPQIKKTAGIFTFNLTLDEIQKNLKPFMAEQLGFSVVDSVISAVNDAGYNKTALEVMIQSTDSSVLVKFKQLTKYKLVYKIDQLIRDAVASSVEDIKTFAHAVALDKESIYPSTRLFTTGETGLVPKFHDAGTDVYVYVFRNEFVSQPWDFFSDATVEINAHVLGAGVDGIITDFPGTASLLNLDGALYRAGNSCTKLSTSTPNYMQAVPPGELLSLLSSDSLPPALAPMPPLDVSDVVEPPLPSATPKAVAPASRGTASPSSNPSSGQRSPASILVPLMMICGFLLLV
ncbi:hypothetical protein BHE74_00040106 [Ensete ventricosum]|nr:hypothetical protein BHE74_00040106 [Ensete ventricosum]